MDLRTEFPQMYEALVKLFGRGVVDIRYARLNEIFEVCDKAWMSNLNGFLSGEVKYILIGEAPPWTETGTPVSYFYSNLQDSWAGRIIKAFFTSRLSEDVPTLLCHLRCRGFLLLDSLPFAMNYSGKRNSAAYRNLVAVCADYMRHRLKQAEREISFNVKIALAFKVNGRCIIEAFSERLLINKKPYALGETLIAADESGYTSPIKLREIWGIDQVDVNE
jgi:hypothetical protein